ncbi:MAG: transglutaminase family protein [Paracoccus sp. (in: a-proteobacteria)]|uniref:transglutaminase family protein n=1 Tax=Paracoccus sp. TaxID=267 RepID=UPI0039E4D6EC
MTIYAMQVVFRYKFDRPTGAGRQQFRILPAEIPGLQSLIHAEVRIEPDPLETDEFTDFWGTRVIELVMPPGLTELEFVLEAEVERIAHDMGLDISAPLARLPAEIAAQRGLGPAAPHHFLQPTKRIPHVPEIAAYARAACRDAATAREALQMLGLALNRDMAFDAKATDVNTSPARAFAQRKGVCQDFAQIMVSGLRGLGIPAAYVAGYLRTLPPPGQPRLVGADATHAWLRAWCGTETGWLDYDPTNACFALGDHIEIGFGQDYDDVAPVQGVLRLDGGQESSHSVDIEEALVQSPAVAEWQAPGTEIVRRGARGSEDGHGLRLDVM